MVIKMLLVLYIKINVFLFLDNINIRRIIFCDRTSLDTLLYLINIY